jgi:DNA-binding transcriptional LysR family regulator
LPDYVARPAVQRKALLPVLPRLTLTRIPLHIVYPSRRHLPRRTEIVLEALRTVVP